MCTRSTVGQVSALYCSELVTLYMYPLYSVASVRALLWGKIPSSNVGQVSVFYCGASVCALLWSKCPHFSVWQVFVLYILEIDRA
jgi:hypothetical protein